eukprot:s1500_g5.t1
METPNDASNAWLGLATSCMSESLWKVAVHLPETTLSHRACPWGGHLVRFDSRNIFIEAAPEDPSGVLVRPEVRGRYTGASVEIPVRCQQLFAPGNASLERRTRMWVVRMTRVLFGQCSNDKGHGSNGLFYDLDVATARHQIRRNFPEQGDCSYVGQGALWISRPEVGRPNRFRVIFVFCTPDEKRFAAWATPLYSMIADMVHKATSRVLNSRAWQEMRRMDANLYTVLSMRSFNRGPPMFPEAGDQDSETFQVAAGKSLGFTTWSRFPMSDKGRFCLADYMRRFMQKLGQKLMTYETLDGRTLVSYQCVVLREDWENVKTFFWETFRIQKAAYRHANGGSSAPTLAQDASPHLLAEELEEWSTGSDSSAFPSSVKTVVRNTFLELEEDVKPPMRRTRSDMSCLSGEVDTFSV